MRQIALLIPFQTYWHVVNLSIWIDKELSCHSRKIPGLLAGMPFPCLCFLAALESWMRVGASGVGISEQVLAVQDFIEDSCHRYTEGSLRNMTWWQSNELLIQDGARISELWTFGMERRVEFWEEINLLDHDIKCKDFELNSSKNNLEQLFCWSYCWSQKPSLVNIPAQAWCMEAEFPFFVVCVCLFLLGFFLGFFSVLKRETLRVDVLACWLT